VAPQQRRRKFFSSGTPRGNRWLTIDCAALRAILPTVFSSGELDGVTLIAPMRKPFDALAEGLVSEK
jgi:hypothetical protein